MKNQNRVKLNIVEEIGVLKSGPYSLELNLVEWGNLRAKYDLRDWKLEGGQNAGFGAIKGIERASERNGGVERRVIQR